jgi:hypothetical protein
MKIIDLLVKISKGEEVPKEIKFEGELCSFDVEDKDYYCERYGNIVWYLVDTSNNMNEVLDTELEIIEEEKEIRKLPNEIQQPRNFEEVIYIAEDLVRKINEIIDVINDMRDKEC